MSLTFDEDNHRYVMDGRRVPTVTTMTGGGLPKPQLPSWSARMVAEYVATNPEDVERLRRLGWEPMAKALAAIPDEVRNTAAKRGTTFHALAEVVSQGGLVQVPPAMADMARGFVAWLDLFAPEVVLTETLVGHRGYRYAGRFDMLAWLTLPPEPRRLYLLDVKTSKGVYGDTALQCAAYACAEFWVDAEGTEHPMPQVEGLGVIHVTDQGTELYDMGPVEPAWHEFQAAMATYRGTQRRRKLGTTPVPHPSEAVPEFTLEAS